LAPFLLHFILIDLIILGTVAGHGQTFATWKNLCAIFTFSVLGRGPQQLHSWARLISPEWNKPRARAVLLK
jgi:hypothetical protein